MIQMKPFLFTPYFQDKITSKLHGYHSNIVATLWQCWCQHCLNVAQWCGNIHLLLLNVPTMLWTSKQCCVYQCCISTKIPMLPQCHHNVGQCCNNVVLTLCEHCDSAAPNVGNKCWDNIQTMLCECCGSVTPHCWWLTLRLRSGNIVWALWQCCSPVLGSNIETTFTQCCVNVVVTLGTNIETASPKATLCEHCGNITMPHTQFEHLSTWKTLVADLILGKYWHDI